MKKIIFTLAVVALIAASCAKTDIEQPAQERVLKITASMDIPGETRSSMEEFGDNEIKNIRFKWEVGDVVQFAFKSQYSTYKSTGKVTKVLDPQNTAEFTVGVPDGISGDFTLYAYRSSNDSESSGVLNPDNPTIAVLPTNSWKYSTLSAIATPMSFWGKAEVTCTNGTIPDDVWINFKHLGSVMTINVKNIGAQAAQVQFYALESQGNYYWVRNEQTTGASWNMATEAYVQDMPHYKLSIQNTLGDLASGETRTYYSWFVPGEYKEDKQLYISYSDSGTTGLSVNTRPLKEFQPGNNYVMYATVNTDNSKYELKFTNSNWEAFP